MIDDHDLLDALEFDADAEGMLSEAAVALCAARAIMHNLYIGDLRLVERIGAQFSVVSGAWRPTFGTPPAWNPATDATAIILGADGQPICEVDTALLIKP